MNGWKGPSAIMPNFKLILGMKTDKSVGAILSKLTCPRKGFINSALALFHIKPSLSIGSESPFRLADRQHGGVKKKAPIRLTRPMGAITKPPG
jgi:hypothetical protein